jgi:hypothetical protein
MPSVGPPPQVKACASASFPTGFHRPPRLRESGPDSTAWAITLGLGLGAGSVAHPGVPLPVVAETTGLPSLAAVVKIAPSVVTIDGRGRVAAAPGTKRRQAGKGIGPVLPARDEIHTFGSAVVFDAPRGLIITNSHLIDHADEITVRASVLNASLGRRVLPRNCGRGGRRWQRRLSIQAAETAPAAYHLPTGSAC